MTPDADISHVVDAYFETGNYARARDVLRGLLAQQPNDADLLAQNARAEYLLENYRGAALSALMMAISRARYGVPSGCSRSWNHTTGGRST